ncbi:hypothetical protein KEM54_000871 [Ascosphaera aggregata]|nr:hypothetical protein KEM54_000871 [Ascosphaera aggregata]
MITDEMASEIQARIANTLSFDKQITDVFMAAVATLPHKLSTHTGDLVFTAFGRSLTMRGIQERVIFMQEMLMGLLLVTVFIEMEMRSEDEPFDSKWVFTTLVDHLKDYEMIRWLYSTRQTITTQQDADTSITLSNKLGQRKRKQSVHSNSLLEDLFLSSSRPHPLVDVPQTWTVMRQVDDVLAYILRAGPVTMQAVSIQCDLIANGNISTAMDFLRFQPSTAWATYVKGRLYLAQSEYATAALCFEKASYLMSHGKPQGDLVELSSSLIDPIAANYFYNGLTKYYQHILSLFEQARAFAFVADFANLALRALQSDATTSEVSAEYKSARSDLLSRLFYASLQSSRYDEAWSAVSCYTDTALQTSALTSLIKTILTSSGPGKAGINTLLRLPIAFRPGFVSRVDNILLSLSEKQKASGQLMSDGSWHNQDYTTDYERVLEAYRMATHDVRGAAEVAYRRVQRIREAHNQASRESPMDEQDVERKELRRELLSLINMLSCMDESEAYILVERPDQSNQSGLGMRQRGRKVGEKAKVFNSPDCHNTQGDAVVPVRRIVVTLSDVRREYQGELDRLSRVESGDYAFGGDPMDEDVNMDMDISTNGRQSRLDDYAPEVSLMDLPA